MSTENPLKPRKSPSQTRSKKTVDYILEAATQVFTELGYEAGTTNKIAERAGISIGTLYQYFPNKDAIIVSLTEQLLMEGLSMIEELFENTDEKEVNRREIPRRFIEGMVAMHMKNPKLHKMLVDYAPDIRSFSSKAWEIEQEFSNVLVKNLGEEPSLRVKDIRLAVPFVVLLTDAVCHWLVQMSLQNQENSEKPVSQEEALGHVTHIVNEMEDMLVRYLFH